MGAGEFALNCALRVLQGWRFSLDNSTPAMFAMRIVAANRYVRGKRNDIGKGSARPVCAGRDEVRIESVGRTRSRQESLTQRLQLHKGGRSEILQGTAHSNVDGSGTVAARHLAGSCRKFSKDRRPEGPRRRRGKPGRHRGVQRRPRCPVRLAGVRCPGSPCSTGMLRADGQ